MYYLVYNTMTALSSKDLYIIEIKVNAVVELHVRDLEIRGKSTIASRRSKHLTHHTQVIRYTKLII